jgi:hypothetical protein
MEEEPNRIRGVCLLETCNFAKTNVRHGLWQFARTRVTEAFVFVKVRS